MQNKYQFCEGYEYGISFQQVQRGGKVCGGVLREIAYDMFTDGYTCDHSINDIDIILKIAGTPENIQWLIRHNFIEPVEIPIVYHTGQIFEFEKNSSRHGKKYILAQIGQNSVTLISLIDGNRFIEPIRVEKSDKITEAEFNAICCNKRHLFAEVKYDDIIQRT